MNVAKGVRSRIERKILSFVQYLPTRGVAKDEYFHLKCCKEKSYHMCKIDTVVYCSRFLDYKYIENDLL